MADLADIPWHKIVKLNPDLQKERETASFNPLDLTYILDGGPEKTKKRRQIVSTIFSHDVFSTVNKFSQSISERYENAIRKVIRIIEMLMENAWTQDDFIQAVGAIRYDLGIVVHMAMFIPSIERMGTEEQQAKWLPLALSLRAVGTYAQTELGHGTNLRNLETTATYDIENQEFVLNTPFPSGMKWWPGGLGKSTNHAVVLANLIIRGKSYGMQAFMVPLRDMDTHMPLPGVELGDIGPKIGMITADNGYLILRDKRIPRDHMLMKYAQVGEDGTFRTHADQTANYGTMVMIRANILTVAHNLMSQITTIATRYSAVRRQSELKPGDPEPQIIDYQTQQHKLFPSIALAYALHFARKHIIENYWRIYDEEIQVGNFSSVPELHSESSGLKAFSTDLATEAAEVCRRSCGGHGYMMMSGMCDLYCDSLGSVTYEGENTVLYLQTARSLIKSFTVAKGGNQVKGSLAYFASPPGPCPIRTDADCYNLSYLCKAFDKRAYYMLEQASTQIEQDLRHSSPLYQARNDNAVQMVRATKAHLDGFIVKMFAEGVTHLETKPEVVKVLTVLCNLHAFHRVVESSGEFLESGALNAEQLQKIRSQEVQCLKLLRPEAVALVDAFDWHDETLCSALGRYDGNVYETMYEWAKKGPMNETEVHPAYHKYIKPFQKKSML